MSILRQIPDIILGPRMHHQAENDPKSFLGKDDVHAERTIYRSGGQKTDDWQKLDGFFKDLDLGHSAFISMNWDTVIERRLAERRGLDNIDYRCDAIPASSVVKAT